MGKRRPLVAGNWKMNGSRAESAALATAIKQGVSAASQAEVAVCPPFILIPLVAEKLTGSPVVWGGQNLSVHKSGAYTGEVSGPMLKDYACTYVIVGHSERRMFYGDTDALVTEKYGAAQAVGLLPILCVGETLQEREANQTEAVVARQLDAVVNKHGIGSFKNAVIAYEPVWAIGTGKTASSQQAQEIQLHIRNVIAAQYGDDVAQSISILYGGSVKAANAKEIFGQPDVDGGLVGGASLMAEEFTTIINSLK